MWETDYAREPVDYRLFFLRLLKKIWIIPLAAVLGSLIVGGIYCLVNFGIKGGYNYRARTIYYVTYASDADGTEFEYYNYYTWQELIHTDYFVEGLENALGGKLGREEIIENTTATIDSDYRYLYTRSTSRDPEMAIEIEKKVSELVLEFPKMHKEIESITVIDEPDMGDIEDISLIFVKRAFILGGVIGLLAVCVLSVFYACTDTSVYLPSTLEKRFHIPCLGAASMNEFEENCRHFLGGKRKVGFIFADDTPGNIREVFSGNEGEVSLDIRSMKELNRKVDSDFAIENMPGDFESVFITEPFCDTLEKTGGCDGLVVVVKAGAHNGKRVERILDELKRLGIDVTAFMLTCEDEWLIRRYYG
ncbi:MAG: hypothetical protein IJ796_02345 [Lachnospiraceae bacterium]|nr:hypothetical protein [Lachnospiraceae bacterium]